MSSCANFRVNLCVISCTSLSLDNDVITGLKAKAQRREMPTMPKQYSPLWSTLRRPASERKTKRSDRKKSVITEKKFRRDWRSIKREEKKKRSAMPKYLLLWLRSVLFAVGVVAVSIIASLFLIAPSHLSLYFPIKVLIDSRPSQTAAHTVAGLGVNKALAHAKASDSNRKLGLER